MITTSARRARFLALGGAVAVAVGLAAPAADAVASHPVKPAAPAKVSGGWHWKDHHAAVANGLQCPTTKLCVGVDSNKVRWTTNPTAAKPHWKSAALEPGSDPNVQGGIILNGVSCPSAHFCLAIDDLGKTFATTNPTGGKKAWHAATIDSIELVAISCASPSLCAGLDYYGNALTSTTAGSSSPTWPSVNLEAENGPDPSSISCVGHSVCTAVMNDAKIFTTNTADSTPALWHHVRIKSHGWDAVSCPTTKRCVAVGTENFGSKVAVSNNAGHSWKSATLHSSKNSSGLYELDCATKSFCFAVGDLFSKHVAAKKSAWHPTTVPTNGSQTQVSCPSAKWCFIATSVGDFIAGHR